MLNSYHCLVQPKKESSVFYETIDESLEHVLAIKSKKLIAQLKTLKLMQAEKTNDIDWFVEKLEKGVARNTDFEVELSYTNNYYYVRYEKKSKFLLIIKRSKDGIMSVRSYKEI